MNNEYSPSTTIFDEVIVTALKDGGRSITNKNVSIIIDLDKVLSVTESFTWTIFLSIIFLRWFNLDESWSIEFSSRSTSLLSLLQLTDPNCEFVTSMCLLVPFVLSPEIHFVLWLGQMKCIISLTILPILSHWLPSSERRWWGQVFSVGNLSSMWRWGKLWPTLFMARIFRQLAHTHSTNTSTQTHGHWVNWS